MERHGESLFDSNVQIHATELQFVSTRHTQGQWDWQGKEKLWLKGSGSALASRCMILELRGAVKMRVITLCEWVNGVRESKNVCLVGVIIKRR